MPVDLDEIRFLGDMQRVQPQPGDVFVLRIEQHLTRDQTEKVRRQWESVMGTDVKLLVLDGGTQLDVFNQISNDAQRCPSALHTSGM